MSVMDRISDKLEVKASGCIEYTGYISSNGYPVVSYGKTKKYIHRVAYEEVYGEIPCGKTVDHLCRNPKCSNVKHLEVVTHMENCNRAIPFRNAKQHHDHEPIWHSNGKNSNGKPRRYCYICKKRRRS